MNGKQLKNSILQWAIQGKLVPQDPNDEPASVLLERIRAEKKRLIKEGKIKKDKNESIIYRGDDNSYYEKFANGTVRCINEDIPFETPASWEWTRLSSVVYNHGQKTPDKDFCYIDIGSINNSEQRLNDIETIVKAKDAPSRARRIVRYQDILYSTVRPYLHNLCIVDKAFSHEPIASTGFAVMACHGELNNRFLFLFLLSPIFDSYANDGENAKGVAYPAINDEKLYKALIPIPPKEEQERIVHLFNSLTPLLKIYRDRQESLDILNASILGKLKKSILQEAIQGKLVPQKPEEGNATQLLDLIKKETQTQTQTQTLIKAGLIKRKDVVDSTIFKGEDNKYYEKVNGKTTDISEEIPFSIPDTWCWVRLSQVVLVNPKNTAPDDVDAGFVPMERIKASYISGFSYEVRKWKDIKSAFTHFANGDVAVAKITPCFQNRKSVILRDLPNGIGAGTTEIKVLRPYGNTINRDFLLYFLKSSYFVEEASFKGTANQQRILSGYLENKLFPLPPLREQERIAEAIKTCITSTMRK